MVPEDIKSFLMKNKVAAFICLIIAVFILFSALSLFPGSQMSGMKSTSNAFYSSDMAQESASYGIKGLSYNSNTQTRTDESSGSYVEVKEGSMSIETKSAEQDASEIRSLTESFGGYIEDERKYDNAYNTNINIRSRIPDDNFQGFVDELKNTYDEKSFTLSFYRVSTQNEINELDILNTALGSYSELRTRAMQTELNSNQIDLLFKITEKELALKRLEKQYTSTLSGKQQKSEYATITITLEQKKDVSIIPENLGNQLRLKAKNALTDTANSLMDIITGSIAVFASAIKYVVYTILFVIPLIVGYRALRKIYGWITRKL